MTQLAMPSHLVFETTLRRPRIQIQKPEISTYRPSIPVPAEAVVSLSWKLMVGFTYLFSFITYYFVLTV